ncbi:MAG: hypothetical protein M1429_00565 [Patescibacteria group bacterium]|nr:hypothetical protein [Patescibacteria group bacterium]
MEKLLNRPDVTVSVVVGVFQGKLLGEVTELSCTFLPDCPFAEKCSQSASPDSQYAILTPQFPRSKVTKRNLHYCDCRLFDKDRVDIPLVEA